MNIEQYLECREIIDYNEESIIELAKLRTKNIKAEFSIDKEILAYSVQYDKGEEDENINHPKPKDRVIEALTKTELLRN